MENRVLIVTGLYPPDIGGPATYSKLLYDELKRRGIDVKVLSFGEVRSMSKLFRHTVFFFKVFVAALHVDVIYAQDTMSVGWPSLCANVFLRKVFIVRVPGDHVWEQARQRFGVTVRMDEFSYEYVRKSIYLRVLWLLRFIVVRYADAVVVPSNYFGTAVRKWSSKANIVTIYNGIEPLPNLPTREKSRLDLGFSPSEKIILSIGRLVPWKGFSELFSVIRKIKSRNIPSRLIIIGDGPLRRKLEREAKSEKVTDLVTFIGAVDRKKLFKYLRAADVFVLNTQFESFSFQTVEAMISGIPVVVSRVGSLPEIITNDKEGILVSQGDTDAFVEAIEKVFLDDEYRKKIIKNAKQKANYFSIERTADTFLQLVSSFGI